MKDASYFRPVKFRRLNKIRNKIIVFPFCFLHI